MEESEQIDTEKSVSPLEVWRNILLFTALLSFSVELLILIWGSYGSKSDSYLSPYTFHWVWEIIAIVAIYRLVRKYKIGLERYWGCLLLSLILTTVSWIFIPNSLKILEANYYGVESRLTLESHEEGRYDENIVYDHPLHKGLLFKAGDPELTKSMGKRAVDNEYVQSKGFLFWQTGVAYGFDPFLIREYNSGETVLDHIELFFTIGPMALVECLINGLYYNFLILILPQIVLYLFKKESIWH